MENSTKTLPTTAKTHITNLYTLRTYKEQLKADTGYRQQELKESVKGLLSFKTVKDTALSKLPGGGSGKGKKKAVPSILSSAVKAGMHFYLSRHRHYKGIRFIFTKLWTGYAEKVIDSYMPMLESTITGFVKKRTK